jgi:hypothetical protein
VTSVVGIQVFDSAGKYLGRFRDARNLAFGGPDISVQPISSTAAKR